MDDAPLISTLPDEDSPPPQPAVPHPNSIKSIKHVVKDQPQNPFDILATTAAQSSALPIHAPPQSDTQGRKRRLSQRDDDLLDEEEPEEDQLIDDEDEKPTQQGISPKKRSSAKPKPKKEKKEKTQKVTKLTLQLGAPPPSASSSVATSVENPDSSEPPTKKKRATPKKPKVSGVSVPKGPPGVSKLKLLHTQVTEDVASIASEGYTGTAASSPGNTHYEPNSPVPEDPQVSLPPPALVVPDASHASQNEDVHAQLEGVPIPSYPLPTKPFPVMPPPKLSSGLAPAITLDKTHKSVRHWRMALREIRGIAGGRWFARTWVGGKESDYASTVAASKSATLDNGSVASTSVSPEKSSGLSKLAAVASLSAHSSPSKPQTPRPSNGPTTSVFPVAPQTTTSITDNPVPISHSDTMS